MRSTLSCFLLLIMLFSFGCDTQILAVSTVADTPVKPSEEALIDAGIVFADRDSYLCLPFEKVGLPSDASVASIKSSCDCLTPSLIEYVDANGHFAKAIFLKFNENATTPEGAGPRLMSQSTQLRVMLDINLITRQNHRIGIKVQNASSVHETH